MIPCDLCSKFFKKKGIKTHLRSCQAKAGLTPETSAGRRMSNSLPLKADDVLNQVFTNLFPHLKVTFNFAVF